MKYILINDIQKIIKEIHMPQIGIVFHVSMWWVAKNIKFDKNYEIKKYVNKLIIMTFIEFS
jgi:hypothetical protein